MTDEIDVDAIVRRCRELPEWPDLQAPDGYPESSARCVIDAIWSMGVRYGGVVNVLERYREWLEVSGRGTPDRRSLRELIDDIDNAGGPVAFADVVGNRGRTSTRNGILTAEAVDDAARKLVELGVDTTADIRERHADPAVKKAWRSVRGQSSGISWHYLLILAGVDDVKADRMICRFVADASERARVTPDEAYDALHAAFDRLRDEAPDLSLRALDNAIWRSQRGR